MTEQIPNGQTPDTGELEKSLEGLSLDELLASVKDDLARTDTGIQDDADRAQAEQELAQETAPQKKRPNMQPLFEPKIPEEYADLTVEPVQQEAEPVKKHSSLPAGIRVLLYVCCVLAASVLLAVAAWRCADDVLSLTKEDFDATVTIADGATISQIAAELQDKGLVGSQTLFKLYCWVTHAEDSIEPGTYTLNSRYDYHALVNNMITASPDRSVVEVTIPEGYECEDIFRVLEENGVCSYQELAKAAATYEFEYDFLQELPYGSENRLEGYLFPDTYQFYMNDAPENVIDKFLRNFDNKFTSEFYDALDALNERLAQQMREHSFTEAEIADAKLTVFDLITVASLVEKETAKTSESATIASVIYNRLCSKIYPCLEIDATIQYVLAERKEILTNADKGVLSPYNTYTNAGLPAGPIANPGTNSIRAALYPAQTNYYFYALGSDGVHHFSETYYEHQRFLNELAGTDEDTQSQPTDEEEADTAEQTNETTENQTDGQT